MTAKHRRPRTGRKIAATAAVLTAGALPLAAAGSAFAAGAPSAAPVAPTVAELSDPPLSTLAETLPVLDQAVADQNPTMQVRAALGQSIPGRLAPALLHQGPVGTLSRDFGGPTTHTAGDLVDRVQPVVRRLHGQGVPTVGEATAALSQTRVPVFGTVGDLTSAVPVGTALGQDSPVLDALGVAGRL